MPLAHTYLCTRMCTTHTQMAGLVKSALEMEHKLAAAQDAEEEEDFETAEELRAEAKAIQVCVCVSACVRRCSRA